MHLGVAVAATPMAARKMCVEKGVFSREQYCIMVDEFDLTLSRKLTVYRMKRG